MLIKSESSDSIDIATKGSRGRVVLRNRNGVAILTERRSSYAAREAYAPHRTWLSNYSMQPSGRTQSPVINLFDHSPDGQNRETTGW